MTLRDFIEGIVCGLVISSPLWIQIIFELLEH